MVCRRWMGGGMRGSEINGANYLLCLFFFGSARASFVFSTAIGKRHRRDLCVLFCCRRRWRVFISPDFIYSLRVFLAHFFFVYSTLCSWHHGIEYNSQRSASRRKREWNEHAQGAHTTQHQLERQQHQLHIIICTEILSAIIIHLNASRHWLVRNAKTDAAWVFRDSQWKIIMCNCLTRASSLFARSFVCVCAIFHPCGWLDVTKHIRHSSCRFLCD